MKDLYQKFGFTPYEVDKLKIHRMKDELSVTEDLDLGIILSEECKKSYDKIHQTLTLIGDIRHELKINNNSNWEVTYPDFYPVVQMPPNSIQSNTPTENDDQQESIKDGSSTFSKRFRFLIGAPALLVAIIVFLFMSKNNEFAVDEENLEDMFIAVDGVNLYKEPDNTEAPIANLSQFQDVKVNPSRNEDGWSYVYVEEVQGYVRGTDLLSGTGEQGYLNNCKEASTTIPKNGEALVASSSGPHSLIVMNPPGEDAIVKLKSGRNKELLSYYVRGGESVEIGNVPGGSFQVSYATGSDYSYKCNIFTESFNAWEKASSLSFNYEERGSSRYPKKLLYSLKNQLEQADRIDGRRF